MNLVWLSPCAAGLRALASAPSGEVWSRLRLDPGAVLLFVRQRSATWAASGLSFFPALVRDPAILEGAVHFLDLTSGKKRTEPPLTTHQSPLPPSGFVDWNQPAVAPIYQAALLYARLAYYLAEQTGRCDPDNAWVCGLLAPLGWLALAAADADCAAACLADPAFAQDPQETEQRLWGLSQISIARRLCRCWQLPRWLAVAASHLALPVAAAKTLGADADLFLVIQLAVRLAQEVADGSGAPEANGVADAPGPSVSPLPARGILSLRLAVGGTEAEAVTALGLSQETMVEVRRLVAAWTATNDEQQQVWENPAQVALLRDLLVLAAENRRLAGGIATERLERDVDVLHQALEDQIAGETQRLRAQKLSALAEFAAGAGHEINNPLAVISGQAQYLLGHLTPLFERVLPNGAAEPENEQRRAKIENFRKALHTIVGQTRRIHQLLNDLMQFARPPRPQKQALDVAALVREVAASLQDLAAQRRVRLLIDDGTCCFPTNGDPPVSPSSVNTTSTRHLGSLAPCHPVMVDADRRQVTTALSCLLRNAIEAAPTEGWAAVRLESRSPGRLEVVVEDNGNGPATAQREHLFDPFYSGRSAGRGRGLGLATAWRLAREHGGDVRFDNAPGGPTRFILSLPLAIAKTETHGEPANGTAH
jgi:signal transduction histidine kinase